ncbi:hypothetical protein PAPYR_7202 [Paratrimastix pyriformis]|uniref:Uncharacterized protein n=1 Tax=Paratrimastix pyriformis TaxID=342808 RepID=A0ABQ8UG84_9EUKA|nr:hypothetical protein PAPYR_7202 [Paratrimastix pyriformis]
MLKNCVAIDSFSIFGPFDIVVPMLRGLPTRHRVESVLLQWIISPANDTFGVAAQLQLRLLSVSLKMILRCLTHAV